MRELLKYLIENIKQFWNNTAIIHNNRSISYIDLIKESIKISVLINKLRKGNEKLKIALYTNNSIEWIIGFLGTIISNNTLILIPTSFSFIKVSHILSINNVDLLLTDSKYGDRNKLKFLNTIIYIKDVSTIIHNFKLDSIFNIYRKIIENLNPINEEDELIVYTPNTLKKVRISYFEMFTLLKELKNKEIFKPNSVFLLYTELTYNYIFELLLPLISNTTIVIESIEEITKLYGNGGLCYNMQDKFEKYKPSTIILTANQFNQLFMYYIAINLSNSCTIKEYLRAIWYKIVSFPYYNSPSINNFIIENRLYNLFPNIEKLIILNSSISLYMEKLLKKIKFPYTVTYGTVETLGLVTYSHPDEFKIKSVGRGICTNIDIVDKSIFSNNDNLNDIGFKDSYGNLHFICRNPKYGIHYEDLNDLLSKIPFIQECIVYNKVLIKGELPYLLVVIDYDQVENTGISSIEEVIRIIKGVITELHIPISRVIHWKEKFPRDSYGRIVNV